VHDLRAKDSRVRFGVESDALGPALRRLGALGVRSLVIRPPTLEELFLRYYDRHDDATGAPATAAGR
jgi:ABC-2 type transport system ATP-binding protein